MGNVLRMDKHRIINGLIGLGWSNRRIHREIGVHRDTIASYRFRFQNKPQVPADFFGEKGQSGPEVPTDSLAGAPLPLPRNAALVPFQSSIAAKLQGGLSAQRIYQDLLEGDGYTGSYDSIKRYVRKVKKKAPHFFERLPVFPGHEAQVDFGQGPLIGEGSSKLRRSWLFKMTLSYSRHSYEELVFHQDVETFLRCHEHAFQAWGGVPATVKLDNLKSGVLRAHLYEPILNPVYLAFSEYWNFVPNPCDPYQPQQKGRVEKDVGYTKSNALQAHQPKSLEEGNLMLRHWNKRWARTRIHGTTKRQVWKQFAEVEKKYLRPLQEKAFPFFKVGERKVDVQGHIEVNGNFYSVAPQLLGVYVKIHFNMEFVQVYQDGQLLCVHRTKQGKGEVSTFSQHRPPYKYASLEAEERMHLERAKSIGPDLHRLIEKLVIKQEVAGIKRIRGMMRLRQEFSASVLDAAAQIALARYNHSYHYLKSLCENLRDTGEIPKTRLIQEHEFIRPLQEYQTHINERTI